MIVGAYLRVSINNITNCQHTWNPCNKKEAVSTSNPYRKLGK